MSTAALIVAAGRGSRAGSADGVPKQYSPLGGEPVLAHSVAAFAAQPEIGDIVVVIHPDDTSLYQAAVQPFLERLRPPAMGGALRQDSVLAGLDALSPRTPGNVLIHDAARPFVDRSLIDRVIRSLDDHAAVLPCLPVTDTLKRASGGHVGGTIDRRGLWRAQTPQGFRYASILAAHRAAAGVDAEFTDDAAIAEWFGIEVALVQGSEANRKLTTAEDLAAADELLLLRRAARLSSVRIGTGYDVHAFGPGNAVMLCGVRIPHQKKLVGHSDADVGLHALTDALLGAIAEGDIGVHFPPSDERWRGAASELFLKHAAAMVRARGGEIAHVDVTFLCESPRIGPHRDAMRARLADILKLAIGQVSIKATTNEGLGFVGRGEGIAAMATATVHLP